MAQLYPKSESEILKNIGNFILNSIKALFWFILIVALFVFCVFMIVFADQGLKSLGIEPNPILSVPFQFIQRWMGFRDPDKPEYMLFTLNMIGLSLSVFSAALPLVYYFITKETTRQQIRIIEKNNPFTRHVINSDDDDDRIMSQYYQKAKSVTVYAGDFDWIIRNSRIQHTIDRLISENKIIFVSSKSLNEIRKAVGIELFNKISLNIQLTNYSDMRGSIIEYEGSNKTFIYRYHDPKDNATIIASIRHFEQGQFLLEQIKKMSNQNVEEYSIVIICGRSGSGKTCASEILKQLGYKHISVGDLFRDIAREKGLDESRESLNKVGRDYLQSDGPVELANKIIEKMKIDRKIVIDGIRPKETAEIIRNKFGRCIIIYLTASDERREERIKKRDKLPVTKIRSTYNSDIENMSLDIEKISDHSIVNDTDDIYLFENKILHTIINHIK